MTIDTKVPSDVTSKIVASGQKMFNHLCTVFKVPIVSLDITAQYSGGRRRLSWGGMRRNRQPFISLVIPRWSPYAILFREYARIRDDKFIGELRGVSYDTYTNALIAHEIGHAFQYYINGFWKGTARKEAYLALDVETGQTSGHDKLWQELYKILRVRYVNGVSCDESYKPTKTAVLVRKKTYTTVATCRSKIPFYVRTGPGCRKIVKINEVYPVIQLPVTNKKGRYITILVDKKACRVDPDFVEIII